MEDMYLIPHTLCKDWNRDVLGFFVATVKCSKYKLIVWCTDSVSVLANVLKQLF